MARQTLGDLMAAIASDAVAPGSGSAAAVGLALAAACAAKAVAITLKHVAPDPRLSNLRQALVAFSERALDGGDQDAHLFEQFMRASGAAAAGPLIEAGERLQHSARALRQVLEHLAAEVDPLVVSDVLAARALCDACLAIQSQNLEANHEVAATRASRHTR
jgi:formiminotetrahydrofolate cyclodeaminase